MVEETSSNSSAVPPSSVEETIQAQSMIEKAEAIAARLKAENDRAEAILSRRLLAGNAEAGSMATKPITPEEKNAQEVNAFVNKFRK